MFYFIIYNNNVNNNKQTNYKQPNYKQTNYKQTNYKQKKIKKKVKFNIPNKDETLVFFDIGTDNKYYGKIVIKLFDKVVPKTCENFKTLCKSKKYYNSPFHRIIKDFMIQGGDYTNGNGTGGMSIYGSKFPDENFKLTHDKPYLISLANSGPNSNGSQFFITTNEASHLDGKHVVFGQIHSGFNVIDVLNNVSVDSNDRPIENIKILNCGCL
jgi:cyclophilin family peptidyl-prolyl cis-trans isomerase